MRVLVVGAGEVGFHLAQRLSEEHQDVVIIEDDPERAETAAQQLLSRALLPKRLAPLPGLGCVPAPSRGGQCRGWVSPPLGGGDPAPTVSAPEGQTLYP